MSSFPPALGGLEQAAESIARAQRNSGMTVQVLTSDYGYDRERGHDLPFPVSRMKSVYVAHTQVFPGLIGKLARLDRRSILHLHVTAAYTPEVTWAYSKLAGHQYCAHVHLDVPSSGPAGLLLQPYKKLLLARVLRHASAVIVPTADYQQLISRMYAIPPGRIAVIENGITHQVSGRPKALNGSGGPRQLLFVGRLSVQKNLPLMVDAIAAYVHRYGRTITLHMVGDGDARPAIEAQVARLGLGDVITLAGAVHGRQLEALYQDADLFLLTSARESFGLVLVEAMAKGLPVVAVNIPAVRNVVEHGVNGLLTEAAPEQIAGAIHQVLADPAFYAAVSASNLATSRRYDWSVVAGKLGMLYDRVG